MGHIGQMVGGEDEQAIDDDVIDDTDGEREVQRALQALAEQQARGTGPTKDQLASAVRALRQD